MENNVDIVYWQALMSFYSPLMWCEWCLLLPCVWSVWSGFDYFFIHWTILDYYPVKQHYKQSMSTWRLPGKGASAMNINVNVKTWLVWMRIQRGTLYMIPKFWKRRYSTRFFNWFFFLTQILTIIWYFYVCLGGSTTKYYFLHFWEHIWVSDIEVFLIKWFKQVSVSQCNYSVFNYFHLYGKA